MGKKKGSSDTSVDAEFLAEADRQVLQSMKEKISAATSFYETTRKFSEIELLSSDEVSAAAKSICDHVVGSHAHSLRFFFLNGSEPELWAAGGWSFPASVTGTG